MRRKDVELVRQLVPRWYEKRSWAEQLLKHAFGVDDLHDVLERAHGRVLPVPGTKWFVFGHESSLHVFYDAALELGGIDFDLERPDPDASSLHFFVEAQIEEREIDRASYQPLLLDRDRFNRAAYVALPRTVEARRAAAAS